MIVNQFGRDNITFNDILNVMTDVLGVVTTSSDVQHIIQRTTGKELVKRDVNIVDDSGTMVSDSLTRCWCSVMPLIIIFLFIC